jgi:tetratricopeptide (TPR) repeat protein
VAEDQGKIEMDPNDAAAYNTQGLSYRDIGQYEQAIELNPDNSDSYRNRGFATIT